MKETITIDLNDTKLLKEEASLISFGARVNKCLLYVCRTRARQNFLHKRKQTGCDGIWCCFGFREHMDSYLKHGLNDPNVSNNRYCLNKAVENFEKETGIK